MTYEKQLVVLATHRENLATARDFEEFRARQIEYIDCLIERCRADIAKAEAETKFVWRAVARTEAAKAEDPEPTP